MPVRRMFQERAFFRFILKSRCYRTISYRRRIRPARYLPPRSSSLFLSLSHPLSLYRLVSLSLVILVSFSFAPSTFLGIVDAGLCPWTFLLKIHIRSLASERFMPRRRSYQLSFRGCSPCITRRANDPRARTTWHSVSSEFQYDRAALPFPPLPLPLPLPLTSLSLPNPPCHLFDSVWRNTSGGTVVAPKEE